MGEPQKQVWIVYDERAATGGTDDAMVLVTCESEAEARDYVREDFPRGVIFVYDLVDRDGVTEGINERRVE